MKNPEADPNSTPWERIDRNTFTCVNKAEYWQIMEWLPDAVRDEAIRAEIAQRNWGRYRLVDRWRDEQLRRNPPKKERR